MGDVRTSPAPAASLRHRLDARGHREESAAQAPRVAHAGQAPGARRNSGVPGTALPAIGDAVGDPQARARHWRACQGSPRRNPKPEVGGHMVTSTELKSANRDGVKLAYLDTGSGDPALVFIHGWCCNHTMWGEQTKAFAQRHRVIAVDLRGMGASDKPDQDYDIDGFAEDIPGLLK